MNNVYIVTMNFPMTKSFQSMVHFNHTVRCSPRFQKLTYMPDQHAQYIKDSNDQFDLINLLGNHVGISEKKFI